MKSVFDTCLYIDFLKSGRRSELFSERTMFRFLTPVVAMELRAGARGSSDVKSLDRLFSPYSRANRIIGLDANLYLKAGEIIQKSTQVRGSISKGFSNDVLIALSAGSIGATLFTANCEDFELISRFLKFKLVIV